MEPSKAQTESTIRVKPGLRVNIDAIWYRVEGPTETPETWTLTGYCISGTAGVSPKKIGIRKTSSEIREYIADWKAGEVFREGFQLPRPKIESKSYPTAHTFIQMIIQARRNKQSEVRMLSA